jgi:two-component system, OmpR family, phosphate regulon response regulator OmpR
MAVEQPTDKILVVDDDVRLRGLLQRFLEEQGFYVKGVGDAEQMDKALSRELFSLIVLDLMLPGEDGLSICKRLRLRGDDVPIIMLTAKGDDNERIEGLQLGADDYLAKPFNPQELDARIRAVLRRRVRDLPGAPSRDLEEISFGPWTLNLGTRVLSRDGKEVRPDHRRVCRAEGAGPASTRAADPRQADEPGPRSRVVGDGAFH